MQPTPPPAGGLDPMYGFAPCYRHPDRLTGVRCVRCNRPICPSCQHAASVGFQCPDDVRAGQASIRRPRTLLGANLSSAGPIITFGLIACAGVLPLALIAGPLRGIPLFWRLIDCSFGVLGAVPLLICRRHIRQLEAAA